MGPDRDTILQPDAIEMPGAPARRLDPWIEKLAWLMDSAIPIGKRWSIGLDGLLGLAPGVGDLMGAAVSAIIILRAFGTGLPRIAIARMTFNVLADLVVGSIPLAGDLFDFAFKSNVRNVEIYRQHAGGATRTVHHWAFLAAVALVIFAAMALPIVILVVAVRAAF